MLRYATAALALGATTALAGPINRRSQLEDCLATASVPISAPGTDDWERDSAPFNVRTPYMPLAIVAATTQQHIVDAVRCGVAAGVKVTPKSGGHHYANFGFGGEDGHLVIELDRMYAVDLDVETGVATVQPGSRLGHVAGELYSQGKRAISHGTCPGVGTGGHVLHGGYGLSSHTKGLSLDWIVEATVVLANATVVTASESENPDLFWALRGAGSSMGIVSEFKFDTFEAPEVVTRFNVILIWTRENSVSGLKTLQEWVAEEMPAEMNARIFFNAQMPNFEGLYYGGEEELLAILEPLIEKIDGVLQDTEETDWLGQLSHFGHGLSLNQTHPYNKQENIYSTSIYTDALTDTQLESLVEYWFTTAKKVRRGWYHHIDFYGGPTSAVSAVDDSSTSYAHRDKLFMHNFYDRVDVARDYPTDGFDLLEGYIGAIVGDGDRAEYGLYFNYPDPKLDQETAQRGYWGDGLERLREIKAAVDPNEVFYLTQSVRPAVGGGPGEGEAEAPEEEESVEEEQEALPEEEALEAGDDEPVEEEVIEEEGETTEEEETVGEAGTVEEE